MAGIGLYDAGADDGLLHRAETGTRARRGSEAGAVEDATTSGAAASVLLGQLHSIRRVGQSRRQAVKRFNILSSDVSLARFRNDSEPPASDHRRPPCSSSR